MRNTIRPLLILVMISMPLARVSATTLDAGRGAQPLRIASADSGASSSASDSPHPTRTWRRRWLARWRQEHNITVPHAAAPAVSEASVADAPVSQTPAVAPAPAPAASPAQPSAAVAAPAPSASPAVAASVTAPLTTRAPRGARHAKKPAAAALMTKPDLLPAAEPAPHTQESPMTAVGDAWKMMAYLIPLLAVILIGLAAAKRWQERTGRTLAVPDKWGRKAAIAAQSHAKPVTGIMGAILGGFHLNNARRNAGSNIRVVESIPVGNAQIHLIDVRGRLLLIGATGAGVSLLTEFQQEDSLDSGDFRALLQAAAADMDSLDYGLSELPASAVVSTLDEAMRDTSESMARRSRRLRTVQEEEDACE